MQSNTQMRENPVIFISSTYKDLAAHRRALHELIKDHFGWHPWCFEIDGNSQTDNTLEVLQQRIKEADLILCIIDTNYGSELAHEPISFTEWEIHTAAFYQKEIKVYIKRDDGLVQGRLASLSELLKDELIGHFSAEFSSKPDLCSKVKRDLNTWKTSNHSPSRLAIQKLIEDPYCLLSLRNLSAGKFPSTSDKVIPFDRDGISEEMKLLINEHTSDLYGVAIDRSANIFHQLIYGYPPDPNDKISLELWADLLSSFYNLLAVTNRLRSGPISAISLAKALFQIRQRLGDKAGMVTAVQCLSGVMNSAGLHRQALSWNNFALDRCGYTEDKTGIWDARGSILGALGDARNSEISLLKAVSNFRGQDQTLGYILARLAGTQFGLKKTKEALRNIELAESNARGLSKVIITRELAPYLIVTGEKPEAEKRLKEGLSICESLGLSRPRIRLIELALDSGVALLE